MDELHIQPNKVHCTFDRKKVQNPQVKFSTNIFENKTKAGGTNVLLL